MQKIQLRIINKSRHSLPSYATDGSSGLDLRASLDQPIILESLDRALVPTGIFLEIPLGYEVQVRPRSGLAIKHGITCLNTPGTIDSDYRGEIKVILVNLGNEAQTINDGDRIAQMVLSKVEKADLILVQELENTQRGEGGFGHTGKN